VRRVRHTGARPGTRASRPREFVNIGAERDIKIEAGDGHTICAAGLPTRRAKVPRKRADNRQSARRFGRTAALNSEVAMLY